MIADFLRSAPESGTLDEALAWPEAKAYTGLMKVSKE